MVGCATNLGKMRNPYGILFIKFDRKKSFGKHRHMWKCNVKLVLRWYMKCVTSYVWTNHHVLVTCIASYDLCQVSTYTHTGPDTNF